MNKQEIIKILNYLSAAYPNAKINIDASSLVWYGSLRGFDRLIVARAAMKHVESNKYFPQVSDMLDQIRIYDWTPPENKEDQSCMWHGFVRGHNDPGLLTEEEVREIYGPNN